MTGGQGDEVRRASASLRRRPATVGWRRVAGVFRCHPVLGVFVVALLARVVVALTITATMDGVVAPDEAIFRQLAATVAGGDSPADGPLGPTYEVTRLYVRLLAAAFQLFGQHLLVGRLLAAVVGAGAAAATTALATQVLATRWTLVAGLIVALLPSQVFFSAQTLKDGLVWLLAAVAAVAMARAAREEPGWRLVAFAVVVAVPLALVGMVRAQTAAVVAIALALAGWWQGRGIGRAIRGGVATGIAVVVPMLVGLGPLALNVVGQVSQTAQIRARHSLAGESGFVDPDVSTSLLGHLPHGLHALLLRPVPWESAEQAWVALAQAEMLLWYPLLALAVVGLWHARRLTAPLAFAVLYAGGTVLVYALAEGDLMTAYRHRGEVVWAGSLLVALALARLRDGSQHEGPVQRLD